jgi:RNA polymerase sigma factor (sigma-70 family)
LTSLLNPHQLLPELFQRHRESLLAFMFKRVQCHETAQDLSQETFLRLLRQDPLAHDENLGGYLYRIADRLAVDYLRKHRISSQHMDILDDELRCPKPLPDEIAILREQCERLLDAIASLPERQRHVFLLRKIDELSYGQIASRLGISEKTVQRYLVNAMLLCQRCL